MSTLGSPQDESNGSEQRRDGQGGTVKPVRISPTKSGLSAVTSMEKALYPPPTSVHTRPTAPKTRSMLLSWARLPTVFAATAAA